MSKGEEMLRLERDLNANPELKEKLDEELKRIVREKEAESDGEALTKAACALGYNITIEELERAAADMEALDDEELDVVAGGAKEKCWSDYYCDLTYNQTDQDDKGHNAFCLTAWHCLTAALHTDTDTERVTCWKDHNCLYFNK